MNNHRKSSMYKWRRKSISFDILQHSDGLSNSTGTNKLDEVISRSRITQVMPTYFKLIPFNIRNFSSIEYFFNSYQR